MKAKIESQREREELRFIGRNTERDIQIERERKREIDRKREIKRKK